MSSYCNVHEINYKTWDCPLCEDDAALVDNYEELENQVEKLQAENQRLRECVEFYADWDNPCCGDYQPPNRARQCLKELEK